MPSGNVVVVVELEVVDDVVVVSDIVVVVEPRVDVVVVELAVLEQAANVTTANSALDTLRVPVSIQEP